MARERTPRPGGFGLPGMRDSAPLTGGDGPSRAEVRRRIDNLYDRAETDSGTYNATRAMALGTTETRTPGGPASGKGRTSSDPSPDSVTRQWMNGARNRLGPTVPAVLPTDPLPGRPRAASRPALPPARPDTAATVRELEAAARPVLELTAGPTPAAPVAELTAALPELAAAPPQLAPFAVELTPNPLAALSAVPSPALPDPATEQTAVIPALTQAAPSAVPPTAPKPLPAPAPAPRPDRPHLRSAKEQYRHKVTAARDLLAQRLSQLAPALTMFDLPQVETSWPQAAQQAPVQAAETAQTIQPLQTEGQWPAQWTDGLGTAPFPESVASVGAIPAVPAEAPVGRVTESPYAAKAAKALDFARALLGRPCLWGAAGPEAYDCSSLTQAAWRAAGVELPRTAQEQTGTGTEIPLTDLQPGDLIFFYDGAAHVGLVTSNGMMIHAPGPGASIREESVFFAGPQAIRGAIRPA